MDGMTIPATTPADGEMLPCPFCGNDASIVRHDNAFYAQCVEPRCGIEGPFRKTAAGASAAWNRRATPSPGKADAERFAFLIDRGLELIACECEVGPPRMWTLGGMSPPIGWFPTQRAAIDAAMERDRQ